MQKKLQLHAVATDKKPYSLEKWGAWWFDTTDGIYSDRKPQPVGHHLHVSSDEEIKEGDKVLSNGSVCTAIRKEGEGDTWLTDGFPKYVSNIRKIVATSNKDLWEVKHMDCNGQGCPTCEVPFSHRIPQDLIEYFVEEQGNVKEIMVDYHRYDSDPGGYHEVLTINESEEIKWSPLPEDGMEPLIKAYARLAFRYASPKYETDPSLERDFEHWWRRNYR